jgi:hypothetical protein
VQRLGVGRKTTTVKGGLIVLNGFDFGDVGCNNPKK